MLILVFRSAFPQASVTNINIVTEPLNTKGS